MAKRSPIEQLDQAIEAMLAQPQAAPPQVDASLAPLLRIAAELRDLPKQEFKSELKADLERSTAMPLQTVNFIREGFHTVTPYLVVDDSPGLADFVKQAFGAEERFRGIGSGGGYHIEVKIGDSMLMLGGGGGWRGELNPTGLHMYVANVDEVFERAVQAGATVIRGLENQPYGDREASLRDRFGNNWYIATRLEAGPVPQGLHTITPYLHPQGAPQVIDFMKRAFGAEEVARYVSPEGMVQHAQVKIGDSMIEMGEAHAEFQPMPSMFYLYVEDADAWYRRAIEAAATSISEPADQPYGDRTGGVRDPFGNQWFIATHIKDLE